MKTSNAFAVVESHEENSIDKQHYMTRVFSEFQKDLAQITTYQMGYHLNQNLSHFTALSPLLSFHINNVGDPFLEGTLACHSKKFEVGVLNWFAHLWGIPEDEYWGYVTSGGTEGNYHGILLGRELFPDGILYTSEESHYSIFKAIRMFKVECQIIKSSTMGEMDYDDLQQKLLLNKDKPAIINANIGTTFKGGIDNLDLILNVLKERGFTEDRFYIHCDAALNGLIAPFLDQDSSLTFKKPIGSISVSAHKFLGSPIPCAIYMTRKKHISLVSSKIDYLNCVDNTISGSRSGHASIFIWYALNMKGHVGLRMDANTCIKNAAYLRDGLRKAGISAMLNENSVVVVFERPMEKEFIRQWQLSCVENMAHVVVMPQVTTKILDVFLKDLVQKRRGWYRQGDIKPPCLAKEIGISYCACCH